MTSDLKKAMKGHIKKLLENIERMPMSEITRLPEYSDEQISTNGKKFTLATWKKQQADDGVQIVVQAYYHKFLGIGIMMADGYVINKSGNFLPLPEEIRLEYC